MVTLQRCVKHWKQRVTSDTILVYLIVVGPIISIMDVNVVFLNMKHLAILNVHVKGQCYFNEVVNCQTTQMSRCSHIWYVG